MLLLAVFLMGIANFAVHSAVLDSDHPMLRAMPALLRGGTFGLSRMLELAVLLVALAAAAHGWSGVMLAYLLYTAINAITGWMVVTGRI